MHPRDHQTRVHSRLRSVWRLACLAVLVLGWPTAAQAATGNQYGKFGTYGEVWHGGGFDACWFDYNPALGQGSYDGKGCSPAESQPAPGEFVDPVGFAVAPGVGSGGTDLLFVLDRTSNLPGAVAGTTTSWRLQELSSTGAVLGVDRFTLPSDNASFVNSNSGNRCTTENNIFYGVGYPCTDFETFGLAVDASASASDPGAGRVYALLTDYDAGSANETAYEILAWSIAPVKGVLEPAKGLSAATSPVAAIKPFPAPAVLSTPTQLFAANCPQCSNVYGSQIQQPAGLAIARIGATGYPAVQGVDPTESTGGFPGTGNGLVTIDPQSGAIANTWSGQTFAGLPNDPGDENFPPAGISSNPVTGSLTYLTDEDDDSLNEYEDAFDVGQVAADLTATPQFLSNPLIEEQSESGSPPTVTYDPDNAALNLIDGVPEAPDDLGQTGAPTLTAAPQVVALSDGLYAAVFTPNVQLGNDPAVSAIDPESPDQTTARWTPVTPGIRLLDPGADPTNDPAQQLAAPAQPLDTLYDTLGNPEPAGACSLTDPASVATGAWTWPSLAAGSGGTVWVLTRGQDSSGAEPFTGSAPQALEGGRELVELAPGGAQPCPSPSGTFTETAGGATASGTTPLTVQSGMPVTFDASGVDYLGGEPAAYDWSFGDGNSAALLSEPINSQVVWPASSTTHAYGLPGTYAPGLTIKGDFGTYETSGAVTVVSGSPAIAAFTYGPGDPTAGQTVNFDASSSTAPAGSTIAEYEWDFGDGNVDVTNSPTDSHTYANPCTCTVTLTVRAADNQVSAPAAEQLVVGAAPPAPTTATTATVAPAPAPAPAARPSNTFKIRALAAIARSGGVIVAVNLPGAGTVAVKATFVETVRERVRVRGRKGMIRTVTRRVRRTLMFGSGAHRATGAGSAQVVLQPTHAAASMLHTLSKRSKLPVGLRVTFSPTGGTAASQLAVLAVPGLGSNAKAGARSTGAGKHKR